MGSKLQKHLFVANSIMKLWGVPVGVLIVSSYMQEPTQKKIGLEHRIMTLIITGLSHSPTVLHILHTMKYIALLHIAVLHKSFEMGLIRMWYIFRDI